MESISEKVCYLMQYSAGNIFLKSNVRVVTGITQLGRERKTLVEKHRWHGVGGGEGGGPERTATST